MTELPRGKTTSEFWAKIIFAVIAVLRVEGVIGEEEAAAWQELLVIALPFIAYIFSRTVLKMRQPVG